MKTTPFSCNLIEFYYLSDENADVAKLPVGRTCFFRLEIPPYKNEEAFKDKLMYAIRFCTAIDADIENAVQGEEDDHNSASGERRRDEEDYHDEDDEDRSALMEEGEEE